MTTKIFTDPDASLESILNKKIGIIGYGNQGRAQALNLKDSGIAVRIGLRKGSSTHKRVKSEGLEHALIEQVTEWADILVMLIPDNCMKSAFNTWINPYLNVQKTLIFSHGFSIHYGLIIPDPQLTVLLCAPSGPGKALRDRFVSGSGLPGLIAVYQDPSKGGLESILAYSKAVGMTRVGVVLSSFREETETDLFGEQVILTGGLPHLIRSAFNTLVDAGYQPVVAWLVCFYEVKMIVDLFSGIGLEDMTTAISDTAEYGGNTRGKRLISNTTRREMTRILEEIRGKEFFREFTNRLKQNDATKPIVPSLELFDQITRELLPLFKKENT